MLCKEYTILDTTDPGITIDYEEIYDALSPILDNNCSNRPNLLGFNKSVTELLDESIQINKRSTVLTNYINIIYVVFSLNIILLILVSYYLYKYKLKFI